MPSSGFPMEDFNDDRVSGEALSSACRGIEEQAKRAMEAGLFAEWLECFVGAYNHIRETEPDRSTLFAAQQAAVAGIIEWDI